MKNCGKCKQTKNLDEFYRQSKNTDGRRSVCITCEKVRKTSNYCKEKEVARKRGKATNRRKTDLDFKLRQYLRSRLAHALRDNQKTGSAIDDLGCSIEDLRKHLESQFTGDMSWDNYGRKGWHIDHIEPLAKFDLTDREQFLKANHYTNLQPLWWHENISKGDRDA